MEARTLLLRNGVELPRVGLGTFKSWGGAGGRGELAGVEAGRSARGSCEQRHMMADAVCKASHAAMQPCMHTGHEADAYACVHVARHAPQT
eukprot:360702-Chlamydomonas_euryale.AAC.2